MSSDKQKDGDAAEKAASPNIAESNEDTIMAKSFKMRLLEFTLFMLFFLTAITHSYVQTSQYNHYDTQMSVKQSFQLIQENIRETTTPDLDQFWTFLVALRLQILQRDPVTKLLKIDDSPDYSVSDVRITTRRVKETETSIKGLKKWVTTDFLPFEDLYNPEIYDNEPIQIYPSGTLLEHSTDETVKSLGGFTFMIPMEQSGSDFLKQVSWLQDPTNGFMASNTASVEADLAFYNKITLSFVYLKLQVQQKPSGLMEYNFVFNRPIGASATGSQEHLQMVLMEYIEVVLVLAYVINEIFIMVSILIKYFGEKSKKASLSGAAKSVEGGKKEDFASHVNQILQQLPEAASQIEADDNDQENNEGEGAEDEGQDATAKEANISLIKFYWDETEKKKIVDGPSLSNAFKVALRRDQRLIMYAVCLLVLPINVYHGAYHAKYDDDLQLTELDFIDIVERNSEWRQTISGSKLLNGFIELAEIENSNHMLQAIFLFFVIIRLLNMLASFFQSIALNLNLMSRIFDFLTSYLITLSFMFLAWSLCQHLLFGQDMKAYSTITQSVVATIMIGLRDFQNLDEMFKQKPNITLLLFISFIIVVLLFLSHIFISLVITIFNEVQSERNETVKSKKGDQLAGEHWTYGARRFFIGCSKGCRQSAFCVRCAKCCSSKAKADDNTEQKTEDTQKKVKSVTVKEEPKPVFTEEEKARNEKLAALRKIERSKKRMSQAQSYEEKIKIKQPILVIENLDHDSNFPTQEDASAMDYSFNEVDQSVIPRRSAATQPADYYEDNQDLAYSDSDISMMSDYDNQDDMQLVKARQRQTQKGGPVDSNYVRTAEETKQLMLMHWNKSYDPYNLDVDLTQDIRHTSNKQDALMIKQREQRCGKVIWTTFLTLIYVVLYLLMFTTRYEVQKMHSSNEDIKEIIWRHPFNNQALVAPGPADEILYIEENQSNNALFAFLMSLETEVFVMKTLTLDKEDDIYAEGQAADLYFLLDEKNYILLQGVTYCANFVYEMPVDTRNENGQKDPPTFEILQYKEAIDYAQDLQAEFDPEALGGIGGYCFAYFLQDADLPHDAFQKAVKKMFLDKSRISIRDLEFSLFTGEAVRNMVTQVKIIYHQKDDGLVEIKCDTVSRAYKINPLAVLLMMAFLMFFLFNLYLFVSGEHAVYLRYKKWYAHTIASLSKIEVEMREMKRPQFCEILQIVLRPVSMFYMVHVILTLYTEFLYIKSFLILTTLTVELGKFPTEQVQANLFDLNEDQLTSREIRETYQIEMGELLNAWLTDATSYRRLAIFNLFLIVAQPLTSASQSMRFRAFLTAYSKSFKTSLSLYVIFFLFTISILFYGLHAFGYEAYEFQSFSFGGMTIFKMMVGRLVGFYYQVMLKIDPTMAMIFTIPLILIKSIFLTVFLALVCYYYEIEVLNKEFSSDINILRSIFFCNISLESRERNKRSKMLAETEAMEKVGDKPDDDKGDDEGKIKLGNSTGQDGAKTVNGGLEMYNKLDIKFAIQRKIPEWAMACADDIRQEVANRRRLRQESISLAKQLFQRGGEAGAAASNLSKEKRIEAHQLNAFNLMVARKDYITYIWFGIQYLFMQGELIRKVTEATENEIVTMVTPYVGSDRKKELLAMIAKVNNQNANARKNNKADYQKADIVEIFNPITNRIEQVTADHLLQDTLGEQQEIQTEIKEYLLTLMDQVEERMQAISGQVKTQQLQNKHQKILKAFLSKTNLFQHNN